MAIKVIMPKMGLTMTEGQIVRWLKSEGEPVKMGEPLLEVSTEKVVAEVESPGEGFLVRILRQVDDIVPIATVIGVIAAEGEDIEDILNEAGAGGVKENTAVTSTEKVSESKGKALEVSAPQTVGRLKISPVAKRVAAEQNLSAADLQQITGTGPGGRIVEKDVLNYAESIKGKAVPAAVSAGKVQPLTPVRNIIASRMTQSWQTPHFYLETEINVAPLQEMRTKINEKLKRENLKVSVTDLLVKIIAATLAENRYMNVSFGENGITSVAEINIGVAVAQDAGLIVPVVKRADAKGIREISGELSKLVAKARDGKLALDEISGGTFTISNLGMFSVDRFTAIINPPESAILSVGRVIDKPVAVNKEIVIQSRMNITLGLDHRAIDGAQGAKFLGDLKENLESPFLITL